MSVRDQLFNREAVSLVIIEYCLFSMMNRNSWPCLFTCNGTADHCFYLHAPKQLIICATKRNDLIHLLTPSRMAEGLTSPIQGQGTTALNALVVSEKKNPNYVDRARLQHHSVSSFVWFCHLPFDYVPLFYYFLMNPMQWCAFSNIILYMYIMLW